MPDMSLTSVLPGVTVRRCMTVPMVDIPAYTGENIQVSQSEFAIQVDGVGSFYARDGMEVIFTPLPDADPEWVQLYLNGQVLVALLHQRKIINFHASSFIHDSRGVMIFGETGAGKTSMTVAFAMKGAEFLSDDLTPVIFKGPKPYVWPLNRDIKLRKDTVMQLGISSKKLKEAEKGTGKQYLDVNRADVTDYPLHTVLQIEVGDNNKVEFHKPAAIEKFSLLRGEICSWEILAGMPETEVEYLQQLLHIIEQVRFVRVIRPAEISIIDLRGAVEEYLDQAVGSGQ